MDVNSLLPSPSGIHPSGPPPPSQQPPHLRPPNFHQRANLLPSLFVPAEHVDDLRLPAIEAFDGDDDDISPWASATHSPQPQYNDFSSSPVNQQSSRDDHDAVANTPDPHYFLEDFFDDDAFADVDFPPSPPRHAPRPSSSTAVPIDLTLSSPTMPPVKKRKRGDEGNTASPATARQTAIPKSKRDSVEVVDLEDVDEKDDYEAVMAKQQAEAVKRQNEEEANRPVKLAEFQCIICMDNPTNLTVTHCGHLFCAECLHSALHAGDKKCCPVCRSTINLTSARGKPKNGTYHLEMKLMTANRKGKQPVKV